MSWEDSHFAVETAGSTEFVEGGVGEIPAVVEVGEERIIAVHARPYDPDLAAEVDLWLSNRPYMSFPTDTPVSTRFKAVLDRAYKFSANLFSGNEIGARSIPSAGSARLRNETDALDDFARLHWEGRQWDVYLGEDDTKQFSNFVLVAPRKASAPSLRRDWLEIDLQDIGRELDQPLQDTQYEPGFEPYVKFDGTDDWIDFGDVLDRGASGNFSFGVAFRTTALHNAGIYGKKAGLGTSGVGYQLGLGSGGAIRLDFGDGTTNFNVTHTPTGGYNSGQRIAVVGEVDRATTDLARLHVNLYDGNGWQDVGNVDISTLGNLDSANALAAGATNGGTANRFEGEVERVVQQSGAGGATANTDDCKAALDERFAGDVDASSATGLDLDHYVPLTENVGTSAGDTSDNGFHGTLTNGPLWTGTPNGHKGLVGVPIFQCWGGPVTEIEPELEDPIKLVYRFHDNVADAIVTARDSGVLLDEDLTFSGDLYESEVGPVAGEWAADLSTGRIRLGSAPVGKLTLTVRGDANPTFTAEPHEILKRIGTRRLGLDQFTDFDSNAFSEFVPDGAVQLFSGTRPPKIADAFDELMEPRSWWAVGRTGLITVGQIKPSPIPQSKLGFGEVFADSLRRDETIRAHWRDRVGYGRVYTVQSGRDLAGSVSAADRELLGRPLLFVKDEDETTRTVKHLTAQDITYETLLVDEDEATALVAVLRALWGEMTEVWRVRVKTGILQRWLGDVIDVTELARYGLDTVSTNALTVVGLEETLERGVELVVWGRVDRT